ncbi:cupin domain-containing protein [Bartonella taylorii]|uniref:Uncharacterized protein n=1 Tax=Bartonella taylorii TaxID=33046 RepID=A0A9Q8Z0Q0_BARTA|nr:hypothetical protein [Bartonella taylorii]USP03495.1 hypothetical protein LAJ60_03455 [Bartonella taylorii]
MPWHTHKVDETLLIIEGELDFFYSEKRITCTLGNVIHLAANVRHKSIASNAGCIYAISMESLAIKMGS